MVSPLNVRDKSEVSLIKQRQNMPPQKK